MIYYRGLNMKRTTMAALSGVLALAALTFCADPGFAQSTSNSNSGALSGSASNSNSNSSLQSKNTNINKTSSHSNSNANSNSISKSGASSNQQQGQTVNYVQTTPDTQTIKNVPNVYAPALAAAESEVCLGSLSAGGSAAGFGLSVGGTLVDQECQLRMNARTLATLGYNVAAREEMCIDPQVRAAMLAACARRAAATAPPCHRRGPSMAGRLPQYVDHRRFAGRCCLARPPRAVTSNINFSAVGTKPVRRLDKRSTRRLTRFQPNPRPQRGLCARLGPGCRRGYQLIGGWYDDCK